MVVNMKVVFIFIMCDHIKYMWIGVVLVVEIVWEQILHRWGLWSWYVVNGNHKCHDWCHWYRIPEWQFRSNNSYLKKSESWTWVDKGDVKIIGSIIKLESLKASLTLTKEKKNLLIFLATWVHIINYSFSTCLNITHCDRGGNNVGFLITKVLRLKSFIPQIKLNEFPKSKSKNV